MVLSDGNDGFLTDDNYFSGSSFLVDWEMDADHNFQELCSSNEQPAYKETSYGFQSDRSLSYQVMPYVFPAEPNSASFEACDCNLLDGQYEQFYGKDFADSSLAKGECSIREALNGQISSKHMSKFSPDKVFCTVPSRTAVQKPKLLTVTVGEVHRRVFGPELMNVSLLGSYLRRAKEKDGGKALRDKLFEFGMPVQLGRRKNGNTTTWTCFVEEEAQKMAADLDLALRKFFPVCHFAQAIREKRGGIDVDLRSVAFCARQMLIVVRDILSCDRSPVHGREEGGSILKKELQDGLFRFSCATHGFGSLALTSAIDLFDALMERVIGDLDSPYEMNI